MSIHRYAARKDINHLAIEKALTRVGASVHPLSAAGCPDLLVGYRRKTFLLEIKNPKQVPSKQRLRPAQKKWHREWMGWPVAVVLTPEDALRAIGCGVLVDVDEELRIERSRNVKHNM